MDLSFQRVFFKIKVMIVILWLTKVTSQTFVDNGQNYSKKLLILSPQGHILFAICNSTKTVFLVIEQSDLPDFSSQFLQLNTK